ncbi:MAG: hypothetical protein LBD55_04015 [Treponema sp.]|jgi:hypothetical protein|nr:hypothetical protein [Treponema sp.]
MSITEETPVRFTEEDIDIVEAGNSATLTCRNVFDAYAWIIDRFHRGIEQSITVTSRDLGYGVHRATLTVAKNGAIYSAAAKFTLR